MRLHSECSQACGASRGSLQSIFMMCVQFIREVTAQKKLLTAPYRLLYCTKAFD